MIHARGKGSASDYSNAITRSFKNYPGLDGSENVIASKVRSSFYPLILLFTFLTSQIFLHLWRRRLHNLAALQVELGRTNFARTDNKTELGKKFKKLDSFKESNKFLKDAKGGRTKFSAAQISSSHIVAIFRWSSYDFESVKDAARRSIPILFAIQESQQSFLDARKLLLTNPLVADIRLSIDSIVSKHLDRSTPYKFPWWDGFSSDITAQLATSTATVQPLTSVDFSSKLAYAAQAEQDTQVLADWRKKIETSHPFCVNPSQPIAKRRVSKTTAKLITKLLEVSHFTFTLSICFSFLSCRKLLLCSMFVANGSSMASSSRTRPS